MPLQRVYSKQRIDAGPHETAPADEGAERFVREAEMGDGWLHPRSSNYTFVVELSLDGKRGFGVYKPGAGEAPLWDFPDGTLYRRECATYELSRLIGWPIVPPTVVREGDAGEGSLQLYVPSQADSNFFSMRESHRDELFRMAVFDFIVNNADRKGGHCLADADGRLWGVDHGLTFHVEHKLRTVIWDFAGQQVPDDLLHDVRCLLEMLCGDAEAPDVLSDLLSEREVDALRERVRSLLDRPEMPHPYSRRDLPWPWL